MKLTLKEKNKETADVTSFIFEPEERLDWQAGQYLHYVLHHRPTDDRGSDRWFTIASAPCEGRVMITTRFSEKGSSFKSALKELKEGEEIEMSHLEGDFTVADPGAAYVFIAGGIGITPFHSILKEADHRGEKLNVTMLYGNRVGDVPYQAELDQFVKNNSNLKITYITAPDRIDEASIRAAVPDLAVSLFYISGPEPMVMALKEVVLKMDVPAAHIKLDDFPGYPAE